MKKNNKQIYMDYAATTPIDNKVLKEMIKYLTFENNFGNPSSTEHEYGWLAAEAVNKSRKYVSSIIKSYPEEIIFTSGATESNNLAIQGVFNKYLNTYNKSNINMITSKVEHKSVLETCKYLSFQGYKIKYLSSDKNGQIFVDQIEQVIDKNTILISIMLVNNELGTIYPIEEIGKLCKKKKVLFHVDAAQGIGKLKINVKKMNIDLLSISSHKIYGPKGIGALYINNKIKNKICPILYGGKQEEGYRSGTLATHQIAGFGKACYLIKKNRKILFQHVINLNKLFILEIKKIKGIIINTPIKNSYPGIINITIPGIDNEFLLSMMGKFAISSGSACNIFNKESSHVLLNLKMDIENVNSSLRFSFGKYNSYNDIKKATQELINIVRSRKK